MSFNVKSSDLNLVDVMNSTTQLSYKGIAPENLKGAFSIKNGNLVGEARDRKNYLIWLKWMELVNIISETREYENLPEELDKYIIENQLLLNGSGLFFKNPLKDKYYFTNFSSGEIDIYGRQINPVVNANGFGMDNYKPKEWVIIQNDNNSTSLFVKLIPYLEMLADILTAFEINILTSLPKGIIVNNGFSLPNTEGSVKEKSLENIFNSTKTFHELVGHTDVLEVMRNIVNNGSNTNPLFVETKITDMSESLIKQYKHIDELIRERIGVAVNIQKDKKERLITNEVESQQELTSYIALHSQNIRKFGFDKVNKLFGLNITLNEVDLDSDPELDTEKNMEDENV